MAWWITGIVWRFNTDGMYSSGDMPDEGFTEQEWQEKVEAPDSLFQHRSGKFMAIYYFICFGMVAMVFAMGLVACVVSAVQWCLGPKRQMA